MKLICADHLGMCFGVRDAIALARSESAAGTLTVLGELVHNPTVLDRLRREGIAFGSSLEEVRTPAVMITAHGASDRQHRAAQERGLRVVEATCPLVHVAHRAVKGLVETGFHPVIIGRRDHVEVLGLTGDLDAFDVVLTEADVDKLSHRSRFGVAAQTTQPIARVRQLVQRIRARFPESEVRFVDTVCQPTKQRQQAAVDIARRSHVVVVIGGRHSNNTRELVRTCSEFCARVHHIETAAELQSDWFQAEDIVGVTAGTSTPDEVIVAVEARLQNIAKEQFAAEPSAAR
jgi:4-hydroxy-3-methylbut-2-enyl diphosphate reductase